MFLTEWSGKASIENYNNIFPANITRKNNYFTLKINQAEIRRFGI
jgi:hypothetical protein